MKGIELKFKYSLLLLLLLTNIYADKIAGKVVYQEYCSICHSLNMSGSLGKDFNIVSYTRTKEEVMIYTTNPKLVFKSFGYTANAMPTFPLTQKEVNDVADYIDSLQPFKKWMKKTNKD